MELIRLRGITQKRAKDLEKLGISDSAQLVRYFPRTYLDMTDRTSILNVYHNDMALGRRGARFRRSHELLFQAQDSARAPCAERGSRSRRSGFHMP